MIIHERLTDTHLFFLRGIFSNFQTCNIVYKGLSFKTTEHAFMWEKARHFGDVQSCIEVLNAATPADAKSIGRKVKGFNADVWTKVSEGYMFEVNLAKYTQNPNLKKHLLDTGTLTIVEANGKPDLIWSCGLYSNDPRIEDSSKWPGKNLLGKVLMEIREKLRSR